MSRPDIEQLLQQHLDGRLSNEEFEQLKQLLRSDSGSLNLYLDLVELDVLLDQEMACEAVTPEQLIRVPSRIGRYVAVVLAVSVCVIVTTVITIRAYVTSDEAPVVADAAPVVPSVVPEQMDNDQPEYKVVAVVSNVYEEDTAETEDGIIVAPGTEFFPGDEIHVEESGYAEVDFRGGAHLLIGGPAVVVFTSEHSADLMMGRALGTVTEPADGFWLSVPGGGVRDLGTQFAAAVGESQLSEVTVLDGRVALELGSDSEEVRSVTLSQGESGAMNAATGQLQSRANLPRVLDGIIAFSDGIIGLRGDVKYRPVEPPPIRTAESPPVDRVDVYQEGSGVRIDDSIEVDLTEAGEQDAVVSDVAADVYLLRFDPVKAGGGITPTQGEVRFRRRILGVITSPERLFKSDLIVGSPEFIADWLIQSDTVRERRGSNEPNDVVSISSDGHGLSVLLSASREEQGIDELRVLVEADVEEAAETESD